MIDTDRRCTTERPNAPPTIMDSDVGACASAGCGPALERVLELCEGVVAPAVRWLNDPADVDEAIQSTRIKVHRNIDQKKDGSLRAWIRQIGVNEARMINRRRFGASRPLPGLPVDDTLTDRQLLKISTSVANRDLWRWAVAQLSENHANAYLLREVSQLSYEEIAEELEIPDNTAKTWVSRARQQLAKLIVAQDPDRKQEQ